MRKNKARHVAKIIAAAFIVLSCSIAHAQENEKDIAKSLENYAKEHVTYAAKHVVPSKEKKAVRNHGGGKFVASYIEIDSSDIQTELRKSNNGYVGIIKYKELLFECQGSSEKGARQAPCTQVRTRRMTEILGYDKKWRP